MIGSQFSGSTYGHQVDMPPDKLDNHSWPFDETNLKIAAIDLV